jgi:hypothetical protein
MLRRNEPSPKPLFDFASVFPADASPSKRGRADEQPEKDGNT